QPRSHVRRRLALAVQQPQRLPLSLLCTGRTSFAPGAGAPTVRGWVWFCCRSTAPVRTGQPQSTSPAGPDSHPGRVLLRSGVGFGFAVGAPPRCERVRHNPRPVQPPLRTRCGCSYGSGVGCGSVVGAPPTVRTGQTQIFAPCSPPFAPGAGAPTGGGWDWSVCRSTAPVRPGAGTTPPHPPLAVPHITPPPSSPFLLPP